MVSTEKPTLQELISRLPPGSLHLIDDRIVAGASNWAPTERPVTIAVISQRRTKDDQRAMLKALLEIVNHVREVSTSAAPAVPFHCMDT